MKALFLHGAIKNAGDFLIAHRSELLIKKLIPDIELISRWEGDQIQDMIQDIDGIIFCGGPFFTPTIYPQDIPLIPDITKLHIPMINVGGGWFGSDSRTKTILNYHINDTSIHLLKHIEKSSSQLSCRDWFTTNMLRFKGFAADMHGCPAWYDTDYIGQTELRRKGGISKICVSDPADVKNSQAAAILLKCLREKFPNAEIVYVFHRGAWEPEEGRYGERRRKGIETILKETGINWINIAGSHEGFDIYDTCDLHIGFRVHAHIYNLSHRNKTILIEEDGRGAGVNQALGLNSIHAYDENRQYKHTLVRKAENRLRPKINQHLKEDILFQIERVNDTEGIEYEHAFKKMQFYYNKMCNHILKITKWQENRQ
ncbi:MAG: polysaccharide pyruvyl transferase family protein [Lachnospiraceae bacterium]|nr:polysaccharide pyruvyl transferase family protein [Lachnospiraceae bacterium]